ncbi:MAG: class I SAM-dependent methyltransferase [Flavobacteriales bacterium]|nr:class I SAM-dependent methyltransferase [Flavobacteriales bacterium]
MLNNNSKIRKSISHIEGSDESKLKTLLQSSSLVSLTQPVFFDELSLMIDDITMNNIKGDIIEAGVWKGATAIYIKYLLNKTKSDRNLWLFDFFDEKKIDVSRIKHEKDIKALDYFLNMEGVVYPSFSSVLRSFREYNLLDQHVKFIQGDIFKTYTNCDAEKIAILRLDMDFYEPTLFALECFYERVTEGGYIIIDDYNVEQFNCKEAVDKFREDNNINNKMYYVGDFVAYWKK